MTGRPGLAIGQHGQISSTTTANGRIKVRTSVRDRDGVVREVTATGDSKGAAQRALQGRLASRTPPTVAGVTGSMTLNQVAEYWMSHRARTGLVRTKGPIKPQTLAAYNDALRLLVLPALGAVRVQECGVGLLDGVLSDLEDSGQSTGQARSVLNQMLGLAVRHGALTANPMTHVTPAQRGNHEVEVLDINQARLLRTIVDPRAQRKDGKRGPNTDLRDVVDYSLGTGCRIGETLAIEWRHLNLEGPTPTVTINGTLVEPRVGFVPKLHRQESTKTKTIRTLILPDEVAETLRARHDRTQWAAPTDPVFVSRTGQFLWPNNIRTRLRAAVTKDAALAGTTPHTIRRTIGTLVAHERGLDAAREQLGHSDPSVTYLSYVAPRALAPDLREVLNQIFADH